MRSTLLAVLALCIGLASTVSAQRNPYVELAARHVNSKLYTESWVMPSEAGGLLGVSFRIPHDLLIFLKNTDGSTQGQYVSEVLMTVEIYQGKDKVLEDVWTGEQYADSYEETRSKSLDVQGVMTFDLAPGDYTYRVFIADENTEGTARMPFRRVVIPDFSTATAGKAIVAGRVDIGEGTASIRYANLSGNISFGDEAFAIIPFSLPTATSADEIDVTYTVRELDPDDLVKERKDLQRVLRSRGRASRKDGDPTGYTMPEPMTEGGLEVSADSKKAEIIAIAPVGSDDVRPGLVHAATSSNSNKYVAVIDLNGTVLENAVYTVDATFVSGEHEAKSTTRFSTEWRSMPLSLYDPKVAIDNLRFMIGKKEARSMNKGKRRTKIDRFRAFWKERDPSPGTITNELMAEYYARIDHAAFEFRTGSDPIPDGLKTDRAEVYILQGPPDDIKREFPGGGGVLERWSYADGSEFVFESFSSVGGFRLVSK